MFIPPQLNRSLLKPRMWQTHNIQLANFDMAQFACYLVSLGPLLGCSLRLGYRPVSSETEDKFEDAMEVTASSPLPELARVLVRFNHIASLIVNANHSII